MHKYHVWTGIGGGYVANHAGTFDTLTQARATLREKKEEFLDFVADAPKDSPLRISGSIRGGYVEMYDPSPMSAFVRTAYIERCDDPGCELTDDDW